MLNLAEFSVGHIVETIDNMLGVHFGDLPLLLGGGQNIPEDCRRVQEVCNKVASELTGIGRVAGKLADLFGAQPQSSPNQIKPPPAAPPAPADLPVVDADAPAGAASV